MVVSDKVNDMKRKGFTDQQIINSLQEEGVSPKEITNALSRSQIKQAVGSGQESHEAGMQQSIMKSTSKPNDKGYDLPVPAPSQKTGRGNFPKTREIEPVAQQAQQSQEEYFPGQEMPQNQQAPAYEENYGGEQQYMPQEDYGGYSQAQGYVTDTDTMIEVAEQVFAEKMRPIIKQIEGAIEFKTISESKIQNLSERLKRIENQIDRLQSAILEEVGSYGRGLDHVKKEMSMMQDSFGKIVNNLADSQNHKASHHKIEKKTTVVHKSSRKKKK